MESLPATPPAPAVSAAAVTQLAYPNSVDMSPRSRSNESFEEPPLPSGPGSGGSKLRLMCSYGGHIVPRPHDKSLCYVGGDTRIVVADRHSSLTDITSKLSKTLLGGRPFTVKYQLPNEDLDSLISVTTDEDLENMIDEYDRTSSQSSHKPSRLRLFLFSSKPESSSSIGSLLDSSAKSEDWFLNALNGSGLIDSPDSLNSLLGLDSDCGGGGGGSTAAAADGLGLPRDVDSRAGSIGSGKGTKQGQDVHSVPDSPLLETTSSFGSASSSPSLANLPPVRVHVEDGGAGVGGGSGGVRVPEQKSGIEEQFSQMGVSVSAAQKQDEGFVRLSSPSPPIPTTLVPAAAVSGEYANKVFSDGEQQSKPAQPQTQPLPVQSQQKPTSGGIDLPSPDSVSSDGSLTNAMSRQKAAVYQDTVGQLPSSGTINKVSADPVDPMTIMYDPNPRAPIGQQAQDTGYLFPRPQFEQHQIQQQQQQQPQIQPQQYIQAGTHYIHHQMHPNGPVQIPSYYSVYPQQPHQPYPVYLVQARPSHPYNLSMAPPQSNMSEVGSNVPSGAHLANMAQAAYGQTRTAPPAMPEMAASGIYRTGGNAGGSHLVQGPSGQQYVGFSQILHPAQSTAPNSGATASNYAYEFADSAHGQIYYSQALPLTLQPQYQNVMLSEAGSQQQQQQHIRTSQPL